MSSKVLLISVNRCTTPDPVFPLGLAHVSAALQRAGHQVTWLDRLAEDGNFEERLAALRPDFTGISVRNIDDALIRKRETYFDDLASLTAKLRQAHPRPVILGGSGFSIYPRQLLGLSGADYGIIGEGEKPLVALVDALENGRDPGGIPGLVFRRGAEIVINPASAGSPARSLAAADRPAAVVRHYLRTSGTLNLQTQRGCAFRCCYCSYPLIEGRRRRCRPPEQVADEFEQLQKLGARYAFVTDSVFNSSPRHAAAVCEAILRRNVRLAWGCFLRPQGLTADLLRLMARAGLAHIEFGSDSFCDSVLEEYGKGFVFDDILRSAEFARAQNIPCCHFLICGGPGETAATLETSFQNSQRLAGGVIMAVVGIGSIPAPRCIRGR